MLVSDLLPGKGNSICHGSALGQQEAKLDERTGSLHALHVIRIEGHARTPQNSEIQRCT